MRFPPVIPEPGTFDAWEIAALEPDVTCRHRRALGWSRGDCPRCGTTDRRDYPHRTRGGRGEVARLMRRR